MAQAFLAAVLFGVATPFSKSLLSGLSTNLLAGLLYLGAAVLLFLPVLWQSRGAALGFPGIGETGSIFWGPSSSAESPVLFFFSSDFVMPRRHRCPCG